MLCTRRWTGLAVLTILITGCALPESRSSLIERGRYVVEIMGCNDCHTPGYLGSGTYLPEEEWLVGDTLGYHGSWGTAYPTNLRLLLNRISEEEWITMARRMRGQSPMTWVMLPKLTDRDLVAVYRFVNHLGPKGTPVPERLPAGVTPPGRYIDFPEPH